MKNRFSKQLDIPEGYLRLAGPVETDNIVNGPGLRAILWLQGCRQHCPGCQNPETWDLDKGVLISTNTILEELLKLKGQSGITFCGGEPFLQAKELLKVAKFCKEELKWNAWSFTGLIYEDLIKDENSFNLIKELDALIDGPFILSKRDIVNYKYRGSSNQRILHLEGGLIKNIE